MFNFINLKDVTQAVILIVNNLNKSKIKFISFQMIVNNMRSIIIIKI